MVPTTMVKDVNNLFGEKQGNKIADLFSDDALDALAHLNPFKSILFIIVTVKTILYIIFSIWGWRADKKFLRDNPQYNEIDIKKLIAKLSKQSQDRNLKVKKVVQADTLNNLQQLPVDSENNLKLQCRSDKDEVGSVFNISDKKPF